jgi:HD-GYP domain-containing protein (c-di-GMP phosphodiesterase class II)
VLKADRFTVDMRGAAKAGFVVRHLGSGQPPLQRVRALGTLLVSARELAGAFEPTHCRIAGQVATGLGLGSAVGEALLQVFERWDGRGSPEGLAGERLALATRVVQLAMVVEFHRRIGGIEAAVEVADRRRGTQFDPGLTDRFCTNAREILAGLDVATSWDEVINSEPALQPCVPVGELDGALEAVSDLADLKSPYMTGHSRAVAQLAAEAANRSGFSEAGVERVRRAGLLHDLGRLGVSSTIWDKPAALSNAELERVRLHPYFTRRMFSRCEQLAGLAELASEHAERLDGSGYPRGLGAGQLSPAARLLAAADVYQALSEPRPYRPAYEPEQAARELASEVKAGRLDGEAVQAVLGAAGCRVPTGASGQPA